MSFKKLQKENDSKDICDNCDLDLKEISRFGICKKTKRVCWRLF